MSVTLTQKAADAMLTAYKTALVTAKIGLYINNLTPTPLTAFTDLTEPDPAVQLWYAEVVVAIGAVFANPDNSISIACTSVQFTADGTSPPVTVYGYFVQLPGTPKTLEWARLLEGGPKVMGSALDAVIVEAILTIPPILAQ